MYIAPIVVPPTYTADIDDVPILAAILISLVVCILYILTRFTCYLLILQS